MSQTNRYVMHATKIRPGFYVGRIWYCYTPSSEPLTKEDLHGFDKSEIADARLPPITYPDDDTIESMRQALWLPPDAKINLPTVDPDKKDRLSIVAFMVRVAFSGGDEQTLKEHGLDPETTSAEMFYAATGEWPQAAKRTATVEVVKVPAEYKNIAADVRTMQSDGWTIMRISPPWDDDAAAETEGMNRDLAGYMGRYSFKKALQRLDKKHVYAFWLLERPSPRHDKRERW